MEERVEGDRGGQGVGYYRKVLGQEVLSEELDLHQLLDDR